MVAKVRFWLLESSRSIAKALSVITLKSKFLFFILQPGHFYKEGNTSSLASWSVVSDSIITWNFEIVVFAKERFI